MHKILRDPDLDLVVALAVADTYLASTTIRNNINLDMLRLGVGNGFDGIRRAGPNEVILILAIVPKQNRYLEKV